MTSRATPEATTGVPKFIDIAVNLTDPVFRGTYHGRKKHDDDFNAMLQRSKAAGIQSMIITGTSLEESREAIKLAKEHGLYATAGCHPTRSAEFDRYEGGPEAYLAALDVLIQQHMTGAGRVVAIGECGLDYDRTRFASEEVQKRHFRSQLSLAKKHHLPLFLHSRAAHSDFVNILKEEGFGTDGGMSVGAAGGVVHSFTGTPEEVAELVESGLYIGVNGCSLKTAENLTAVKAIPLDKIMFETDAPWCSMTSTQASREYTTMIPPDLHDLYFPAAVKPESFKSGKAVKGRNEPSATGAVAWVVHKLHGDVSFEEVAEKARKNTVDLFRLDERTS